MADRAAVIYWQVIVNTQMMVGWIRHCRSRRNRELYCAAIFRNPHLYLIQPFEKLS